MNPARLRAYIQLLIVVVIWGIAPAVIKFGLNELPPFLFLTYRFLITSVVLLPFYLVSKNKGLTLTKLPLIILVSFLGTTLNLGLLFYGTNLTTSLDSSLITATAPIFVALIGVWFLKEHVTKREKIGIAITIAGTLLIAVQAFFEKGTAGTSNILGNLIIFASNFAFVAYLLFSKETLRKGVSPMTITFMMFLVGFLTTVPLALTEVKITEIVPKLMTISFSAQLSVIFMALGSGALAYFLYQKAQKTIEASEAAIFTYLTPIVTAPLGVIWLHEQLTPIYVIGSVIIAVGVFLAEIKKKRYN
ncbi:MAG TPA: DMT family transporter [Patescibacteria group bacterium]|nr:DMT family transporter [Patescibacteria group bacterium]